MSSGEYVCLVCQQQAELERYDEAMVAVEKKYSRWKGATVVDVKTAWSPYTGSVDDIVCHAMVTSITVCLTDGEVVRITPTYDDLDERTHLSIRVCEWDKA